jgi:hypothetical protein
MFAFRVLVDEVVVEPTVAVADDLVAFLNKCVSGFRVTLDRLSHGEDANQHIKAFEDPQEPPNSNPSAVFEGGFDIRAANALLG